MTHWKQLDENREYLGHWDLSDDPNQERIVTIEKIAKLPVFDKKSNSKLPKRVAILKDEKPMVLNATNSAMIEKLYGTGRIQDWGNKQICIYVDQTKVKGELTDCLRIRNYIPKTSAIKCSDCKNDIELYNGMNPSQLAEYTKQSYGRELCSDCAKKAKESKEQVN